MIRTPRTGFAALLAIVSSVSLFACDETRDPPPRPNPDQKVECVPEGVDSGVVRDGGGTLACSSGEVCIQGRCYGACEGDGDCGPREECASSGVCVSATGPLPDSGPDIDAGMDAGPVDPCADVMCEGALICHPGLEECTDCSELSAGTSRGDPGFCEADPVCDVANGVCVPELPEPCRPCNLESDCEVTTPGDTSGSCIVRSVFELSEQVCLVACSSDEPTCPAGMGCNVALGRCLPAVDVSCTTWLRGVAGAACFTDADCNPRGDTGAVVTGACVGGVPPPDGGSVADGSVGPDAGPGTAGTCRQPCGVTDDCAQEGFVCDATFFCAPMG